MKFAAIVFDMDGVLLDTERLWREIENDFFRKYFPDFDFSGADFTGSSLYCVLDFLKKNFDFPFSDAEFLEIRKKFALEKIYKKCEMMPNAHAFLKKISAKMPAALGTSSCREWMNAAVARHDLDDFFAAKVSVDDAGKKGKPAPDIFLKCAEKLKIPPEKCVVIEDSTVGILAAKNAKMTVFGFQNGGKNSQNLSAADEVFSDFSELFLEKTFF